MNLHFSEVAPQGWKSVNKDFTQTTFGGTSSGLYYKHILMIVSDNRKWCLYYKCAYDRNWRCSLPS